MQRIPSSEVQAHIGERVRVAGWLHALRRLGGITFVVVRDGWGIVQAVAEDERELGPLAAGEAGVESVVAVEGLVVWSEKAPGGIELREPRVTLINAVTEPPPVALNKREIKASLTTILDHGVVTNRHPARRAIL